MPGPPVGVVNGHPESQLRGCGFFFSTSHLALLFRLAASLRRRQRRIGHPILGALGPGMGRETPLDATGRAHEKTKNIESVSWERKTCQAL